jgi:ornithine carbamoyltransferase
MKTRHVLSILDVSPDELLELVERAVAIAANGGTTMWPLMGGTVGIYFRCSSTRTRTSFTVAAHRLGAETIHYGPNDLQLVTGESIGDTARVLSGFLNALVIRTNQSISEMELFASQNRMPIINAMSENEHPTQAIADLATIRESFGRLDDLHVLYLGEGNNTAASLALAISRLPGMQLTLLTPAGYGLPEATLAQAQTLAREYGAGIEQHHRIDRLPANVDVVYTTRWQTMGVRKSDANWKTKFQGYGVTSELMAQVSKPTGTIFLHDLPAVRGDDVTDKVLDGPQSRAFRQSEYKMFAAMAVLSWCVGSESEKGEEVLATTIKEPAGAASLYSFEW